MKLSADEDALTCSRCGYCNAVCPTFGEFGWESGSPRGWIYHTNRLNLDKSQLEPAYAKRVFQCTLCGHCKVVCQSRIDTLSLWKTLRSRAGAKGLWPDPVTELNRVTLNYKNPYRVQNTDRNLWAFDIEDLIAPRVGRRAKIAYFVGCTASLMGRLAGVPNSMVKILEKTGVDYTLLGPEEWCCGSPMLLMGEDPHVLVKHNVEELRRLGVETVVTTCAGCYRALAQDYPRVYGEDLRFEILHSSQFLARLIDLDRIRLSNNPPGLSVTYHDPCELGRHCGVFEEPRRVLESVSGLRFTELPKSRESTLCCGGGGLLKVSNPRMALSIGSRKILEAAQTETQSVVSGCPACELNIQESAADSGSLVRILDIVEVVAEAVL